MLQVNTYSPRLKYTLEGLVGATNYSIYVTAVSSHYESKMSNVVTVLTEGQYTMCC